MIEFEDHKKVKEIPTITESLKKSPSKLEGNEDNCHNLDDISKVSDFTMKWKTFNFADNTTMHGMRYIFMRDIGKLRR